MFKFNDNYKNIEWNKLIKGIRLKQGLTQKELGRLLEIERIQLLKNERTGVLWIKNRNKILRYIQINRLNITELLDFYNRNEYLDKYNLWYKLVDGIQSIKGYNNEKFSNLLNLDKNFIRDFRYHRQTPRINVKSKILNFIDTEKIEEFLGYSNIKWRDYFNKIRAKLPISKTMLAKLLGVNGICVNGLINGENPKFRLRKELIELKELIDKKVDIRDVIFEKKKQRLFDNEYLWMRYLRIKLKISQDELVKNTNVARDLYSRFELGQQNLVEDKRIIIEEKLKYIAISKNIDYKELKLECIKDFKNYSEIKQWSSRKDISEIIGFRTLHKEEKSYINYICKILKKQGFITFTNADIADSNLQIFNVDIYAIKMFNRRNIKICFEVRDRTERSSINMALNQNISRLDLIKRVFNFDHAVFIAPNLSFDRKRHFYRNIIMLDNKDLNGLKNYDLVNFFQTRTSERLIKIKTLKDFKEYLKQNRLTIRDVVSVTGLSFSIISKLNEKNIVFYRQNLDNFVELVNKRGKSYVKFQRYKKIYTNKTFLRLKAIKKYLNLSEKQFKLHFGIKPSELTDKCLRDTCQIPDDLFRKIKHYLENKNYNWIDLENYIRMFTENEFKKWKQLEYCNKKIDWKFIKISENTNKKSKVLENKTYQFLLKRYKYVLNNVQVYLEYTNQIREIDLIGFNTKKDILITECKLRKPGYGSEIIINDLETIKKSLNARNILFVTKETNLIREFKNIM